MPRWGEGGASAVLEVSKIAPRLVEHGTSYKAARRIMRSGFKGSNLHPGHVWTGDAGSFEVKDVARTRDEMRLSRKVPVGTPLRGVRGTVVQAFAFGRPVQSGKGYQVWRPDQLQPIGHRKLPKEPIGGWGPRIERLANTGHPNVVKSDRAHGVDYATVG